MFELTKRVFTALCSIGVLLCASAAVGADQPYSGMTLTVLGANTDVNTLFMSSYGQRFEQETGATLNIITGTAPDNLSKALASKGQTPSFQVLMLEPPTQAQAIASGIIQKLDYRQIPNIAHLAAAAIPVKGYGPAWDLSRLGTCINVAQYKAHNIALPTNIEGWFDPAIAGHAILPSPDNFWWLIGMPALAEHYHVAFDDPTPLFKRLQTMRPQSFFVSSGQAQAALQSGTAWLAPTSDGRCYNLKVAGQPVDFVPLNLRINGKTFRWVVTNDTWEIPVGVSGKQLELAEKFINMALEASSQIPFTEKFGFLPTSPQAIKEAMENPAIKKAGIMEGDLSFGSMYAPPAQKLIPYTSKWLAVWNQMFVK